jgi:hypothetical protein
MRRLKLLFLGILLLTIAHSRAQVSVNVNFGTPPVWAPADRVEVQYYYLPEIDSYYDVPSARFIYIRNGKWFRSASLPYRYRNYNLRGGQVVYLTDYRGNSPYIYHSKHREKYHPNNDFKPEKKEKKEGEHREKKENNHKGKGKKR